MGHAGFQPGLFHVLQHGQGDFEGWAKSHQQRRDRTFSSTAWIHDARRLDGIPIWKEARSRANRSGELGVATNRGKLNPRRSRSHSRDIKQFVRLLKYCQLLLQFAAKTQISGASANDVRHSILPNYSAHTEHQSGQYRRALSAQEHEQRPLRRNTCFP